jgi:hypothetical protein
MVSQNKRQAMTQARETHRLNIQKSLEHRLQVAKIKGNEQLINQLTAEIQYFR